MITNERYTVIDKLPDKTIKEELCIINFNILQNTKTLKKFIENNKSTVFWCATNNFSKQYIETASKLGIQNVVEFPVRTELIDKFFCKNTHITDRETFCNYTKLKNSNLLIVDDNKLNISLLEEIFYDTGIKTFGYTNPEDAIKEIEKKKYNLCLLDILMPEMSGFELAERIKQSTLNSNTPIVFISAVSGNENILNGYNAGAYSYIEKPFSPKIVKAQIYNFLKAKEEESQKLEENDNFIASLTHDLKSPINAEIIAIKYILKELKNDSAAGNKEILSELLNSAQYMKLITDKILCHYKQKSAGITLNRELIDFGEVILSSIEEMRYLAHSKNIKIRFSAENNDCRVFIDKLEMKRVINNLIANAVEYSNNDSFIDIRLFKENKNVICEIEDYGIGINLEKYKSIFDEYVTLSKEQKKTGFGLGLSISKSITEAHGGMIDIISKPNKGTKVSVNLSIFTPAEKVKAEG
ncbi:MAG: hybrid sensor histidine kinase/response regulator [Cyanobacteria bacterium RUI128]|nr:hybrid sensor histidine kinase/response regulator [Cyanobacteria bacterium RUI128]